MKPYDILKYIWYAIVFGPVFGFIGLMIVMIPIAAYNEHGIWGLVLIGWCIAAVITFFYVITKDDY
jgi:hypothetical protein